MGWIIGKGIGVPFRMGGGTSWSSYWKNRSDFWYKEDTRSSLTLPNAITPGTNDASILLPLVDASFIDSSHGLKLDTGTAPLANTVFVLKGRSTITGNHNIGIEDDPNTTYFIFGVNSSKWRILWGNKSKSSANNADTDLHVFIMYNAKLWVRPITTELTDSSILNIINTITPDIDAATESPNWVGTVNTIWLGSMNYATPFLGSFAHSESYIGTITGGEVTWQKKFIFNNEKYAYDLLDANGSVAWANRVGATPTMPVKLYSQYGSDYCLNNGHTLLRLNSTEKYSSVPYLISGTSNHTVANLTGYETVGDFDGNESGLNYTDCLIRHSDDFFDRSNDTIWKDEAISTVNTYYDSGNVKDWHLCEHNFNKIQGWLNSGYEGRCFFKTGSNSMDYYDWTDLKEIIVCTDNQEDSAFTKALTYSGDLAKWIYPLWNKSTFITADIQKTLDHLPLVTGQTDEVSIDGEYGTADVYKWIKTIEAPNGKLYAIPFSESRIMVIDSTDDSVDYINITLFTGNSKYASACLASNNGCLYLIPSKRLYVGKIDPTNNTHSELAEAVTDNAEAGGHSIFYDGQVAPSGMIYAAPCTSEAILKINPFTDTWQEIATGLTGTTIKYNATILAPNGYIYFIPMCETQIMKLNPADDSITFIGSLGATANKWNSAAITPDGIIYCMPLNIGTILKIDTNTDTISQINTTVPAIPGTEAYTTTIYAVNGYVYGIPANVSAFIKLNPADDSVSYFGDITTEIPDAFYQGVQCSNGSIYSAPYKHGTKMLKLLSSFSIDRNIALSRIK